MESVSIFEAFFGGMGEFPCNHHISTIPVFIGSLAGAWLLRTGMRRVCLPVMLHSIFFITGTSLTLAFTGIASLGNGFFINYFQALSIGACIIIILTGIYLIASTRFPVIDYETRLSYRHSLISGYLRALVIGVFYGFLVTPCLSPTLAAIITQAFNTGSEAGYGGLLFVYFTGYSFPFILAGVLLGLVLPWIKNLPGYRNEIYIFCGLMLAGSCAISLFRLF